MILMNERYSNQDSVQVLNSSFIRSTVPMSRAIQLMETAFRMLSEQSAYVPERVVMTTPDDSLSVFFKPAFMSRYNRLSIKILTQILANSDPDVPTIKGLVLLIDMVSGKMLSISDGQSITALRTGAASGIATSLLANPDASSVAVFGCGAQGRTQLEAVMAVRPVRSITLFDTAGEQASVMAREVRESTGIICDINPALSALAKADVICTATPSHQPLFDLTHLKPGVHINAVGSYRPDMQEIDPKIIRAGLTYLDDSPACLTGSGDLLVPLGSGMIEEVDIMGELGQLIAGTIAGRRSPNDITIFKSVGNAIQDFFIANEAYEKSLHLNNTQIINLNS